MADGELVTAELIASDTALEQLSRAEIDVQIATAHRFPRSITLFQREAQGMVTLSAEVAAECSYVLPRDGKQITGPSARFAEIIYSCWGNSRAGARVIGEDARFVTAQGIFHDLQKNVAITYEVKRRITTKNGKTFGDDMIGVTANAACSIALRNAILKGVPKAFWAGIWNESVRAAKGDAKTLPQRREAAIAAFVQQGISEAEIFKLAKVRGKNDIDLDKLFELSGILTALNDGDTTKSELLKEIAPPKEAAPTPPKMDKAKAETKKPEPEQPADPEEAEPLRSPEEVLSELESVVSGITALSDLNAVEDEYLAMPELSFPGDKSAAQKIIERKREEIEAQ